MMGMDWKELAGVSNRVDQRQLLFDVWRQALAN